MGGCLRCCGNAHGSPGSRTDPPMQPSADVPVAAKLRVVESSSAQHLAQALRGNLKTGYLSLKLQMLPGTASCPVTAVALTRLTHVNIIQALSRTLGSINSQPCRRYSKTDRQIALAALIHLTFARISHCNRLSNTSVCQQFASDQTCDRLCMTKQFVSLSTYARSAVASEEDH